MALVSLPDLGLLGDAVAPDGYGGTEFIKGKARGVEGPPYPVGVSGTRGAHRLAAAADSRCSSLM
jgi:hypothetical protein